MAKKTVAWAMRHEDKLGAGARRRRELKDRDDKVHTVMSEFKRGTLHSGSGGRVKKRKQAIAIAMSESGRSRRSNKRKPQRTKRSSARSVKR